MKEERALDKECLNFRENFEPGSPGGSDDGHLERLEHADQCVACTRWSKQINGLVEEVSAFTQYDVPESATQKILAGVSRERKINRVAELSWAGGSLVAFATVLVVAPFDSIDGLCSWMIGAVFVAAFGVLARTGNKPREFAQE